MAIGRIAQVLLRLISFRWQVGAIKPILAFSVGIRFLRKTNGIPIVRYSASLIVNTTVILLMLAYYTMTILLGSDVLRSVLIYCIITVYEFVPLFHWR